MMTAKRRSLNKILHHQRRENFAWSKIEIKTSLTRHEEIASRKLWWKFIDWILRVSLSSRWLTKTLQHLRLTWFQCLWQSNSALQQTFDCSSIIYCKLRHELNAISSNEIWFINQSFVLKVAKIGELRPSKWSQLSFPGAVSITEITKDFGWKSRTRN